jgi:hypothetical protein
LVSNITAGLPPTNADFLAEIIDFFSGYKNKNRGYIKLNTAVSKFDTNRNLLINESFQSNAAAGEKLLCFEP